MVIVYKKVDDLIPYENNPRRNENAVDAVAESIRQFGWQVPVVVDKDNVIAAGHTRILAAKRLGIKEVPCVVAEDLTEEQIRAFRLVDNRSGELAMWDFDRLREEFEGIDKIDLSEFGFLVKQISEAKPDTKTAAEEAAKMHEVICPRCGKVVSE